MWPNINASNGRRGSHHKAANVKGYLGRFATVDEVKHDDNDDDVTSCGDLSSLGGLSARETSTMITSTTTTTIKGDHRSSIIGSTSSPTTSTSMISERTSARQPSVLVEIPENFPQYLSKEQQREDMSVTNQNIADIKRRILERDMGKDDASAILEIQRDLFDMDNYLLSVYMNDEASIYTTTTTTNSSFSSSASSVSSTFSTRRRHRGAHHNRRRGIVSEHKGTWLDSMRESSTNVFIEGGGEWTPLRGWRITPKKTWDPEPDDRWNEGSF